FFFFFQAEDGIRDLIVTGVQTCALPIWACGRPPGWRNAGASPPSPGPWRPRPRSHPTRRGRRAPREISCHSERSYIPAGETTARSEERRVGKGCRARWGQCDEKEKGIM